MKADRLRLNPAAFLALTIASALAACSNEEPANDPLADGPVALAVTADISTVATRVSDEGTSFTDGDRIGIFPVKNGQTETEQANRLYTYNNSEFGSTSPYWFQDRQQVDFHAYYPYDETLTADDNYTIDIDTRAGNQENMEGLAWRKNDYLAASAQTDVDNPEASFTGESAFSHVMSQIQFVFRAGTSDGVSDLNALARYYIATPLTVDGTFDPATGTVALDASSAQSGIGMNIDDASGTEYNATPLILLPQTIDDGKLALEVTYNRQTYKAELDAPTGGLQPGYSYTYTVTIKNTELEIDTPQINTWTTGTGGSGDAFM